MNSVCARTAVWLCVHPAGITGASAASLISQHHGTCLNSKRGLERTSWPPGESLRLPSTHSGHSSYHTLFNYTMSNPPVGLKKKTALKCVWCAYLLTDWRWGVDLRQWDFFAVCGSCWICCMISSSSKRQNCATTIINIYFPSIMHRKAHILITLQNMVL